MTTSAAVCIPYYSIAVIGSDGQMTMGDRIVKATARKYMVKNGVGFVFAGEAYAGTYVTRLLKKIIPETDQPDLKKVVLELHRKTFEDAGEGRRVGDASGFLVSPTGLYSFSTIDLPVAIEPIKMLGTDVFLDATGSGGEYALGGLYCSIRAALSAEFGDQLPKKTAATVAAVEKILKARVHDAIEAGIKYDRNSGGTPSVEVL